MSRSLPVIFSLLCCAPCAQAQDSLAALHNALRYQNVPAIQRLVTQVPDINAVHNNYTAMQVVASSASSLRDTQLVNYIGARGANLNKDPAGVGTPLYLISRRQGLGTFQVPFID